MCVDDGGSTCRAINLIFKCKTEINQTVCETFEIIPISICIQNRSVTLCTNVWVTVRFCCCIYVNSFHYIIGFGRFSFEWYHQTKITTYLMRTNSQLIQAMTSSSKIQNNKSQLSVQKHFVLHANNRSSITISRYSPKYFNIFPCLHKDFFLTYGHFSRIFQELKLTNSWANETFTQVKINRSLFWFSKRYFCK